VTFYDGGALRQDRNADGDGLEEGRSARRDEREPMQGEVERRARAVDLTSVQMHQRRGVPGAGGDRVRPGRAGHDDRVLARGGGLHRDTRDRAPSEGTCVVTDEAEAVHLANRLVEDLTVRRKRAAQAARSN
jgi:hypothetical protein